MAQLNSGKVKFIDDPLYHQDDAAETVATIAAAAGTGGSPRGRRARVPRDLPPYCRSFIARRCCRPRASGRCS